MLRPVQHTFVNLAMARLRFSVLACCWILALSLIAQMGVWLTATFTDVRFTTVKTAAKPAMIVNGAITRNGDNSAGIEAGNTAVVNHPETSVDANRVLSPKDSMMHMVVSIARAAAMLAFIVLMPLMMLGVLLGASSATPGVEHTAASFVWAVILGVLLLPIGQFIGLPWRDGAMYAYSAMTSIIDATQDKHASFGLTFYAQFGFLPLACLIGVAMVGLRFCAGLEAGLPRKEDLRLDPVLEREAANIAPTSLHGPRGGGGVLRAAPPSPPAAAASASHPAGMTQPTAGVAPTRLI